MKAKLKADSTLNRRSGSGRRRGVVRGQRSILDVVLGVLILLLGVGFCASRLPGFAT